MKNEEQIREEIRAVLNRILDEEFESALALLREAENCQIKGNKSKEKGDALRPI